MENLSMLTPLAMSRENSFENLTLGDYDWSLQRRTYMDQYGNLYDTCMGLDTGSNTTSGSLFSDDQDQD